MNTRFLCISTAALCSCFAGPPNLECNVHDPDAKRCEGGFVCVETHCARACQVSEDCPAQSDGCVSGACQPFTATCSPAVQCLEGFFCTTSGVCLKELPLNSPCGTDPAACLSGFCEDGVCCPEPCGV